MSAPFTVGLTLAGTVPSGFIPREVHVHLTENNAIALRRIYDAAKLVDPPITLIAGGQLQEPGDVLKLLLDQVTPV